MRLSLLFMYEIIQKITIQKSFHLNIALQRWENVFNELERKEKQTKQEFI